ncbi:MAG: caspase family protein [Ferruginibacter sp.]
MQKSKALKLFIILFFTLQGYNLHAQSFYEFSYYFEVNNVRKQYKAFLVRHADGTGFMITRYFYESGEGAGEGRRFTIEEDYARGKDGLPDTTLLVLKSTGLPDPALINASVYTQTQNDTAYDNYQGPLVLFKKDSKTGYFEPAAIISPYPNVEVPVTILQMNYLPHGLDERTFPTYFMENDPLYGQLFFAKSGLPNPKTTSLHLIIVANTNDNSIGNSCVIDKDGTYKFFKQICEVLNVSFKPKIIFGSTYSKKNVDLAITNLRPKKDDIVVFYYSGHGFSNTGDKYFYPYLDLREKTSQKYGGKYALNIQDIYESLKSKGARLTVVVSDCCNSDPSIGSTVISNIATTRDISLGWNEDLCKQLFMDSVRRSILMTAASKGEVSAGNNNIGGIFSYNMRASLEKFMSPFNGSNVSWEEILVNVKQKTISKAANTLCPQADETYKPCTQNPLFKLEKGK